jgi:Tol biopolymer transport system component
MLVLCAVADHVTAAVWFQGVERMSIGSNGEQAYAAARTSAISADGSVVAFVVQSALLVPGDLNGVDDVLIRDRTTGETLRVSVSSQGIEGDLDSVAPALSANGRVIAFQSDATNLVPGDTNAFADIFVHNRDTGETTRVSISSLGVQADLPCLSPDISDDGQIVTFMSYANTLIPHDTTLRQDIFVHDRSTGETELVSVSDNGTQGNDNSWAPVLSGDGRYVAYRSQADNLVQHDSNSSHDIFVYDRVTATTTRVSISTEGVEGNSTSLRPWMSGNGRYVSFHTFATNFSPLDTSADTDVYVHDRRTGVTEMVSLSVKGESADDHANNARISADGRFVSFESFAGNLVPGGLPFTTEVYLRDRHTRSTVRVSMSPHGAAANATSALAAISADGHSVVFESLATNLAPNDTNGETDIYVVDL